MTDNTATTAPSADQPKPADHSDTARVVSGFSRPPATGHRSAGPRPGHADETEISAAGIALDAHPGIHRGHPPARPSPAPPCGPTYSPSANAPNCSTAGSGNCRSGCPNARRNGLAGIRSRRCSRYRQPQPDHQSSWAAGHRPAPTGALLHGNPAQSRRPVVDAGAVVVDGDGQNVVMESQVKCTCGRGCMSNNVGQRLGGDGVGRDFCRRLASAREV